MPRIVFILVAACGLEAAVTGRAQVLTNDLVFEANANTDTNANDGWSFTQPAIPGGGGALAVTSSGAPAHSFTPEGGGFFRSTGINQNFGGSVTTVSLSDLTCEIWLRRNGDNSEGQIASFRRSVDFSGNNFHLAMTAGGPPPGGQDNQLADVDFSDRLGVRQGNFDMIPAPVGEWRQVVITYRDVSSQGAADGVMNVYTNGNQTPIASFMNNVFMAGGTGSELKHVAIQIINAGEGIRGFQGDIAIVRIYGAELTPAEITQNYRADGPQYGLITIPPPPAVVTSYTRTGQMGFAIDTDTGVVYQLEGSNDGADYVPTGAFVRGDGGEKVLFDPRGAPTQAFYQVIRGTP